MRHYTKLIRAWGDTKILGLKLLTIFSIFIIGSNASASSKPMIVNCSIFNNGFKEIPIESEGFKKIALNDISMSPEGNHLLKKVGNYEFWLGTYAVILDPKPLKVTDFKIEIRNINTGVTNQVVNSKTEFGLSAAINMVKYSKENPYWPIAELSFECRKDMS